MWINVNEIRLSVLLFDVRVALTRKDNLVPEGARWLNKPMMILQILSRHQCSS